MILEAIWEVVVAACYKRPFFVSNLLEMDLLLVPVSSI